MGSDFETYDLGILRFRVALPKIPQKTLEQTCRSYESTLHSTLPRQQPESDWALESVHDREGDVPKTKSRATTTTTMKALVIMDIKTDTSDDGYNRN